MKIGIILFSIIGLAILSLRLLYSEIGTPVELTDFAKQTTGVTKGAPTRTANLPLKQVEKLPQDSQFVTITSSNVEPEKSGADVDPTNLDMRESFYEGAVSPEDETFQENPGVDAMQVEISLSAAPEAGYSTNNGNTELAIPSERSIKSTNMDE